MTTPNEFLHLASGSSAANVIEETLRRLGRSEAVTAMRDSFEAGPLGDVDAGAARRIDWYARIDPKPFDEAEARRLDDSDLWERVHADTANVMLWHGPHPAERLFALRACWHLREQAERVHEVALPASGIPWTSGARPAFYDAVAIAGPNATVRAWDRRVKVTDVAARAKRWQELRDQPGDWIRVLTGEDVVQLPVTAFDADVVKACADGAWTESLRITARIIAENPIWLSVLVWRIRELLRSGTLECRGDDNRIGLPSEVRLASGSTRGV